MAWTTRATLEPARSRSKQLALASGRPPHGSVRCFDVRRVCIPALSTRVCFSQYLAGAAGRGAARSRSVRVILTVYALLLLIVSVAVVAILTGARVSGQYREIGLLKAVGLTPRQVSTVFAIEAATLGLVGIVIGFVPGALMAPRLVAGAATTLLGSPTVAANPWHILVAGVVILPVIVVNAFVSARKSTRSTVLQAIRSGTLVPASGSRATCDSRRPRCRSR